MKEDVEKEVALLNLERLELEIKVVEAVKQSKDLCINGIKDKEGYKAVNQRRIFLGKLSTEINKAEDNVKGIIKQLTTLNKNKAQDLRDKLNPEWTRLKEACNTHEQELEKIEKENTEGKKELFKKFAFKLDGEVFTSPVGISVEALKYFKMDFKTFSKLLEGKEAPKSQEEELAELRLELERFLKEKEDSKKVTPLKKEEEVEVFEFDLGGDEEEGEEFFDFDSDEEVDSDTKGLVVEPSKEKDEVLDKVECSKGNYKIILRHIQKVNSTLSFMPTFSDHPHLALLVEKYTKGVYETNDKLLKRIEQ